MDPRVIILALLVSIIVSSDTPTRNPRQIPKQNKIPDPDPNPLENRTIPWPEPFIARPDGGVFADGGSYTAAVSAPEALRRLSAGICDRLFPCQEPTSAQPQAECERIVQETNQMNRFFGLLARNGLRPTLLESSRPVSVDPVALDRCLLGLGQVTCEDIAERRGADQELLEEFDEAFGPAPEGSEDLDPFYFGVIQTHSAPELRSCREIFSFEPVVCGPEPTEGSGPSATQRLANALCSRMATCNSEQACEPCLAGLESLSLGSHLGLISGTLGGIEWGVRTGIYQVNTEALDHCVRDISETACHRLGGFRSLSRMIPSEGSTCDEVFHQAAETCQPPSDDPALRLAAGICTQLVYCEPELSCEACIEGALGAGGVAPQFGFLGRGTLRSVSERWTRGTLALDSEAMATCFSSIQELSCDRLAPTWTQARPNRFMLGMALSRQLDPVCRQVFSDE